MNISPNHMHTQDRVTRIAEVPADLRPLMDMRDESLRLASFAYSATVLAGDTADFRYPDNNH